MFAFFRIDPFDGLYSVNLTFRANVDTMEVQNLDQLFSMGSTEQQRRFWNVMQAQSVAESNFGMRLVNKGDQITNRQYTFTGFNYVVEAVQLNLCAKTHIPMTKLFGRSPAGLNSTGEGDLQNYYDYVDGEREDKLRPVLEKLLPVMCMSAWGKVPDDVQIVFPSLETPDPMAVSQIGKTKTDTVVTAFQNSMLDLGAAQKELKKLAEETGLFDSITDEEIEKNTGKTYQDVTAMRDPLAGLMGGDDEDDSKEGENSSPFQVSDSLVFDFNKNHDPDNGQFAPAVASLWPNKKVLTYVECQAKLEGLQRRMGEPSHWNEDNLKKHFGSSGESDHSGEYPGWNINNYQYWACALLDHEADDKSLFGVTLNGYRYRYFIKTNDYVMENIQTGIITMFKPTSGKAYYDREISKNGKR